MTWGEIKKATLSKMFAADNGKIDPKADENLDYVAAMPQAANEGMQYICDAARRPRRSVAVPVETGKSAQGLLIQSLCGDFFGCGEPEAYLVGESGVPQPVNVQVVANEYLIVPANMKGTLLWYYDAKAPVIDAQTADDYVPDMDDDALVLLPLYMASELYKDDDLRIATYYRNEFDNMLAVLSRKQTGTVSGEFTSVTGWW